LVRVIFFTLIFIVGCSSSKKVDREETARELNKVGLIGIWGPYEEHPQDHENYFMVINCQAEMNLTSKTVKEETIEIHTLDLKEKHLKTTLTKIKYNFPNSQNSKRLDVKPLNFMNDSDNPFGFLVTVTAGVKGKRITQWIRLKKIKEFNCKYN
jgi:hypothetical protein